MTGPRIAETGTVCPHCGSPYLNTLAWVCDDGGFADTAGGEDDQKHGINPMIACFDCGVYGVTPMDAREYELTLKYDEDRHER